MKQEHKNAELKDRLAGIELIRNVCGFLASDQYLDSVCNVKYV